LFVGHKVENRFEIFGRLIGTERDEKGKKKKEKGEGEKAAGASIHLRWRGTTRQPASYRRAANGHTQSAPH